MRITVDVEHRTAVTASWYSIWEGAVAIGAMCIYNGFEGGIAAVSGGLSVTLQGITALAPENGTDIL